MGRGGSCLLEEVERFALDDGQEQLRESTLSKIGFASRQEGFEAISQLDQAATLLDDEESFRLFAEAALAADGKGGLAEHLATCMYGAFCGSRQPGTLNKRFSEQAIASALAELQARWPTRPTASRFHSPVYWSSQLLCQKLGEAASAEAAKRLLALEPWPRFNRLFKGTTFDSSQAFAALFRIGHYNDLPWPSEERLAELINLTLNEKGMGDRLWRPRLRARIVAEVWPSVVEELTSAEDGKIYHKEPWTVQEMWALWKSDYPQLVLTMEQWVKLKRQREAPKLFEA